MVDISVMTSCKNSPKREFLKDFNIAFANLNMEFLIENVTDDIDWRILGDRHIQGIEDFTSFINDMKNTGIAALTIQSIITHGKEGAVAGEITDSEGNTYAFCDVYTFQKTTGTTIKSMQTYMIQLED